MTSDHTDPPARLSLPPDASSASVARRWVSAHLADRPDNVVDTARLLVSELVTNAVLHADSGVAISLETVADGVRVGVSDTGYGVPTLRQYSEDAATGRGLMLLEGMADRWGIETRSGGKLVWFELGATQPEDADGLDDEGAWTSLDDVARIAQGSSVADEGMIDVRLVGVPLALMARSRQDYDDLLREFRLIGSSDSTTETDLHRRLARLADEISSRYDMFTSGPDRDMADGDRRGDAAATVVFRVPATLGPDMARYDELLDEAERWCRAGALLTVAPRPESVAVRKWMLAEFSRQAAGLEPTPWPTSGWAPGGPGQGSRKGHSVGDQGS